MSEKEIIDLRKPRFIPEALVPELFNLWHLSRVPHNGRHDRLIWTSDEFAKKHNLRPMAVYKDLCDLTR